VSAKILVVDDDAAIRRLLARTLDRAGYAVVEAADARAALNALAIDHPDLVLLDLGLPDRDGLELLPILVRPPGPAVIVLTAREATDEKVTALDLGADDYITKPFDTEELLARVRSALRRAARAAAERVVVGFGDAAIDLVERRVTRSGDEVRLTPKEYALLAELARHPGRVLTHHHLLRAVWGPAHLDDVEYLRVTMRGLRLKLEADPAAPSLLRNEPGVGYRLEANES
jgi:two-component system KDP operon response regulator KdpE